MGPLIPTNHHLTVPQPTLLQWPPPSLDLNPVEHHCGETGGWQPECVADNSAETM